MQFITATAANTLTVKLSGTFRFDDHEVFKGALDAIDGLSGDSVIFDLADVSALDSAGVGMLLLAHERGKKQGKVVRLRGGGHNVKQVLDVTKVASIMPVED
ncbi:STAS domain-containing protein [Maricaulis sp.]|uniref:STAS domain-containing protein n=1 Tax=Maricaulis sp. TaxID=1486257 RepID=UPI00261B4EBB|nr:STAS domain-containing protein [Maricaulis sp.]